MLTSRIKLTLQPLAGEQSTQVTISGSVPTLARPQEMRRLIAILVRWSGQPVGALCAAGSVEWREIWTRSLCDVPRAHLELESDSMRGAVHDVDGQMSLFGAEP